MKNLKEVEPAKPEYNPSKAILVECEEDNAYLTDLGLNQYYPIITEKIPKHTANPPPSS